MDNNDYMSTPEALISNCNLFLLYLYERILNKTRSLINLEQSKKYWVNLGVKVKAVIELK